jgi:molybdopterin-guanine dinucleotide biosynthesis protein B
MRVIQVAGLSGAGKTYFISRLVPRLRERGRVAVVKHLGHHPWTLQEGKDTTVFFESGAVSVGIDSHKSVMVMGDNDLEGVLGLLDGMGITFTVIEGFKEKPYPKITIGGLPNPENVLLEDPTVEVVLKNLDRFPEFSREPGGIPRRDKKMPFSLKVDIPAAQESINLCLSILARLERDNPGIRGSLVQHGPAGDTFSLRISAPEQRAAYTGMITLLKELEEAVPARPISLNYRRTDQG